MVLQGDVCWARKNASGSWCTSGGEEPPAGPISFAPPSVSGLVRLRNTVSPLHPEPWKKPSHTLPCALRGCSEPWQSQAFCPSVGALGSQPAEPWDPVEWLLSGSPETACSSRISRQPWKQAWPCRRAGHSSHRPLVWPAPSLPQEPHPCQGGRNRRPSLTLWFYRPWLPPSTSPAQPPGPGALFETGWPGGGSSM